jgi:serine/threonine protein kinase
MNKSISKNNLSKIKEQPVVDMKDKKDVDTKKKMPTLDELREEFKPLLIDFEIEGYIGQGSYGLVVRAINKRSGTRVAIKKFKKLYEDDVDTLRVLREISILRQLDHPKIVKLLDIIIPDKNSVNPIFIVMEHCDTDLKKLIYDSGLNFNLRDNHIAKIMLDILSALDYLASRGILHRDLKPSNILLNWTQCDAKICDFGLARDMTLKFPKQDLWKIFYELNPEKAQQIEKKLSEGYDCDLLTNFIDENLDILSDKLFSHYTKDNNPTGSKIMKKPLKYVQERLTNLKLEDKENNPDLINTQVLAEEQNNEIFKDDMFLPFKANLDVNSTGDLLKPLNLISFLNNEKDYIDIYEKLTYFQTYLRKELTPHISTRWYRSPEVILCEEIYTNAIDVWACGCILYELLQKLNGNSIVGPLFPGSTCHPLSPCIEKDGVPVLHHQDQMVMIFSILGSQSEDDLTYISSKDKLEYLKRFENYPKRDFSSSLPFACPESLQLLKDMLAFNPLKRITVSEAIYSPYFAKFKDTLIKNNCFYVRPYYDKQEEIIVNNFDREDMKPGKYDLKKLFIQEYKNFRLKYK